MLPVAVFILTSGVARRGWPVDRMLTAGDACNDGVPDSEPEARRPPNTYLVPPRRIMRKTPSPIRFRDDPWRGLFSVVRRLFGGASPAQSSAAACLRQHSAVGCVRGWSRGVLLTAGVGAHPAGAEHLARWSRWSADSASPGGTVPACRFRRSYLGICSSPGGLMMGRASQAASNMLLLVFGMMAGPFVAKDRSPS